jgi:hypothetical protein
MMGPKGPETRKMPYVDNHKLDGFLDFFKTKKCESDHSVVFNVHLNRLKSPDEEIPRWAGR